LEVLTEVDEEDPYEYGSGSMMARLQNIENEYRSERAEFCGRGGGGGGGRKERERDLSGKYATKTSSPFSRSGKVWHESRAPMKPKAKSKQSSTSMLFVNSDDEGEESCVETGSSASSSQQPIYGNPDGYFANFVVSLQSFVESQKSQSSPSTSASSSSAARKSKDEKEEEK
jgi:hypothetical protein